MEIKIQILPHFDQSLSLPSYETLGSAGADIRAQLGGAGQSIVVAPHDRVLIPTGLCFEIPRGYEIQVRPRSGLALKTGLMILNSPGTIDSDYRGELKIIMGNLGKEEERISHGDRIAQIVLVGVVRASFVPAELTPTKRGEGGFGHTGRS